MPKRTPRPDPSRPAPVQSGRPPRNRTDAAGVPGEAGGSTSPDDRNARPDDGHEGATEDQVGDRTGPGVGYDQERRQVKDEGGVS
jgi:hypothetical protein